MKYHHFGRLSEHLQPLLFGGVLLKREAGERDLLVVPEIESESVATLGKIPIYSYFERIEQREGTL